jgi:CDP-glycerol glycerophosphotransferase (TagB/SpsB family)
MRIAFLFNHDQIHQVAHSLPIALALARSSYQGEIIVATTTPRLAQEVRHLGGTLIGSRISHIELGLSGTSRFLVNVLGSLVPAHKVLVYRDNLDFFRRLDVLVVAEKASLILKKVHGLDNLRIVHTRHGAGDRAIGFDKASAEFDHILCSGPKIRDRLIRETGVPGERISIVGYPKFDQINTVASVPGLKPGRPVVLYNPHPSPHLSSWYRHGRAILDFFVDNDDYQLIFAPHVMLFERPFVITVDRFRINRPGRLADKYLRSPNIHVDLGSRSSTDMTYTQAADLYLGDVSSQVYEFLYKPRPCLFFNSHGHAWQDDPNFEHWKAGPVISDPQQLGQGLRDAIQTHAGQFQALQLAMRDRSFDLSEKPSSDRAAEAILHFAASSKRIIDRIA